MTHRNAPLTETGRLRVSSMDAANKRIGCTLGIQDTRPEPEPDD